MKIQIIVSKDPHIEPHNLTVNVYGPQKVFQIFSKVVVVMCVHVHFCVRVCMCVCVCERERERERGEEVERDRDLANLLSILLQQHMKCILSVFLRKASNFFPFMYLFLFV
jgi:L-asparagine transporter-like permease